MSEYAALFTPFWKSFDVVLTLIGVWIIVQPSVLVESYAKTVFSRERGEKLGFPPDVTTELLTMSAAREDVRYDIGLMRLIGASFVVAGLIGVLTAVPQAILLSALTVIMIGMLTFVLVNGKRTTAVHAAGPSDHVVPWWLVGVLVGEAAVDAIVGTSSSVTAAIATLLCALAVSLLRYLPIFVSGRHVVLEREIDRRFRVSHLCVVALFSQLPSIAWAASLDDNPPWSQLARIAGCVAYICVVTYMVTSSRRLDRDLRRAVADNFT